MSGQFSPTSRPARPGAYFNFEAQTPPPALVNTVGIVALAFTHNWGPANQLIECNSFSDFLKYFGDGGASANPPVFTDGYKALLQAFQGEGLPGRGGAGQVKAYRMVGTSGAASAVTLQNTAPAAAITLTARYPGTYGNNITVSVVPNARNPATQMDLNVYVQGFLTETWTFANADITGLAAQINNPTTGSKWVVASGVTSGTALAAVATPVPLTAGDDGATLTGTDYTNMMSVVGTARFGSFAVADIAGTATWTDSTGSSVLTSILQWQAVQNQNGKRFFTIIGGSAADTATSAEARSALANDFNVINIGIGSFTDAVLGALDTSQLAPRLAGIIAARTERQGLSFARLAGLSMVTGANDADILASLSAGFMTISRDSNALSPLRFEKGLTTFTSQNDAAHPLWAYTNPKFVLTMQALENDLTEWAESNVVGQLPVDDNSVQFVLGNLKAALKQREADQVVQPGWTAVRNPQPAPTPQDEFISVLYGISFIRDMEQVLNTVVVQ